MLWLQKYDTDSLKDAQGKTQITRTHHTFFIRGECSICPFFFFSKGCDL